MKSIFQEHIEGLLLLASFLVVCYILLEIILFATNSGKKARNNIRYIAYILSITLLAAEALLRYTGRNNTSWENQGYAYISLFNPEFERSYFALKDTAYSFKMKEYTHARKRNHDGITELKKYAANDTNEVRIIGLGDSFTEGCGAEYDSSWVKVLESNINKNYLLKKPVHIINAGLGGSDPFFEFMLLKNRLIDYKPSMVILCLNSSDIYDVIVRGDETRFNPNGTFKYNPAPSWEFFFSNSYIFRFIINDILDYNWIFLKHDDFEIEKNLSINKIFSCLLKFKELSEYNHFNLLVVLQPHRHEIINGETELAPLKKIIIDRTDIQVLDLLDYYKRFEGITSNNSSNYYWKIDSHHNAKGYAAFARGVEWKLKQMGIIDSLMKK